jgi:hypothetical protein
MLSIPRQGELLLEHGGFDTSILPAIRQHTSAYPHTGDRVAAAKHVPRPVAEQMTLIGSAKTVSQRLAAYKAAGVQVPVLSLPTLRALATG